MMQEAKNRDKLARSPAISGLLTLSCRETACRRQRHRDHRPGEGHRHSRRLPGADGSDRRVRANIEPDSTASKRIVSRADAVE